VVDSEIEGVADCQLTNTTPSGEPDPTSGLMTSVNFPIRVFATLKVVSEIHSPLVTSNLAPTPQFASE
jgi:hypothetical protein